MIANYIFDNYKEMEPIFVSDLLKENISKSALTQQLGTLCKKGILSKYDNGIYYIPKRNKLLNISMGPSADLVARYKYISNGKSLKGYYSGHTFANQIGLTTQVPRVVEIVSNNTSVKYREVEIGERNFVVRKSLVPINEDNVYVLQLLDLLKNIDFFIDGDFSEAKPKVYAFISFHHITKEKIDKYIRDYPVSVFKNYYEMELQNVLA